MNSWERCSKSRSTLDNQVQCNGKQHQIHSNPMTLQRSFKYKYLVSTDLVFFFSPKGPQVRRPKVSTLSSLLFPFDHWDSRPAEMHTARNKMSVTTSRLGQPRRIVCALKKSRSHFHSNYWKVAHFETLSHLNSLGFTWSFRFLLSDCMFKIHAAEAIHP